MKLLTVIAMMMFFSVAKSQSIIQKRWQPGLYGSSFNRPIASFDSNSHSKWSVSKYAGFSMGYSFFKGGSASSVSVPLGIQLNRKLTNNLYAFAGVNVAPTYINFNSTFIPANGNKLNNSFFTKGNNLGLYSRAELGLTYVNDAKTFSISGSVGIERNDMPVYYSAPGTARPNSAFAPNKN